MSDQPSGKVSAQKPASAHLKTVLINTVVPSHFYQDYRRVQAGQLPGCGHLVLVSRLAQQRSHPLDERLAAQQPAMRRGLKGVCRSPRQSLLDEPPVGRLGIVAARLATPGRMQSLAGHPSNAPPAVVARKARPGPVARVIGERAFAPHGIEVDVAADGPEVLPRQESFASLHVLTRRASEGSEALPSLARRVRMSFFGARVIALVLDQFTLEPALKCVPRTPMTSAAPVGVSGCEMLHSPREVGPWRPYQQVEVIGHQDKAEQVPSQPANNRFQALDEPLVVAVVAEHRLSGVAPRHHVVDRAGKFDPQGSSQCPSENAPEPDFSGVSFRDGSRSFGAGEYDFC